MILAQIDIEENPDKNQHFSRKLKADLWIDDRNVGGLPDWGTIYRIIKEKKTYEQIISDDFIANTPKVTTKRKWWQL
jgi:hypothetical protein